MSPQNYVVVRRELIHMLVSEGSGGIETRCGMVYRRKKDWVFAQHVTGFHARVTCRRCLK